MVGPEDEEKEEIIEEENQEDQKDKNEESRRYDLERITKDEDEEYLH
jgi:hypothetical protein